LAFHPRDLVLEHELALLEALELQLIGVDVHGEPLDDLIEVTMLYAQLPQLLDVAKQLAIDIVFDFRHLRDPARSATVGALLGSVPGPPLRIRLPEAAV